MSHRFQSQKSCTFFTSFDMNIPSVWIHCHFALWWLTAQNNFLQLSLFNSHCTWCPLALIGEWRFIFFILSTGSLFCCIIGLFVRFELLGEPTYKKTDFLFIWCVGSCELKMIILFFSFYIFLPPVSSVGRLSSTCLSTVNIYMWPFFFNYEPNLNPVFKQFDPQVLMCGWTTKQLYNSI